jgi:hypothetical protein
VLTVVVLFFPVTIDYGISAFEVRDHPAAQRFDNFNAALDIYKTKVEEVIRKYKPKSTSQLRRGNIAQEVTRASDKSDNDEQSPSSSSSPFPYSIARSLTPFLPVQRDRRLLSLSAVSQSTPSERTIPKWRLHLLFSIKDTYIAADPNVTIFTKPALLFMRSVEKNITSHPAYEEFCWTDGEKCHLPDSLLPFFFPRNVHVPGMDEDGMVPIPLALGNALKLGIYFYTDEHFSPEHPLR